MPSDVHQSDASATDWPLPAPEGFDLEQAIREDRIEFWYQPKIDLSRKRLVGLEAFARLCDTDGNVIQGAELVAGASKRGLILLTEKALISALQTSTSLLEIGVVVRLAINVSVGALTRLPLAEIVQKYQPRHGKSTEVIFDVAESQVLTNADRMRKVSKGLRDVGLSVAVDDFGASLLSLVRHEEAYEKIEQTFDAIRQLGNIQFSEMKIDRTLVRSCSESEDRRKVCGHIVRMAHEFGSSAVAVGIENTQDLRTLKELGCDIGQGYLFGRPMTEDELLMMLWDRSVRAKEKQHAA